MLIFKNWKLKVCVLILEGWKFLFLFLNIEGSYFCSSRLKILVFALVGWTFIFVFGGWRFLIYVWWNVYLHILNFKKLKKSFNFWKIWFVKCDLNWWKICERWNVFDENYLVAFIFVFKHLDFWSGRLNWNKLNIFTHTCYFCAFMMAFVAFVL